MASGIRIYLSYPSVAEERAVRLYDQLVSAGFEPWMDRRDLLPGDDWQRASRRVLRDADFVLALSNAPYTLENQNRELQYALEQLHDPNQTKPVAIIPVRLESGPVPSELTHLYWFDYFEDDEAAFNQLVDVLHRRLERQMELALTVEAESLYVERLELKNIRCFQDLTLSFTERGAPAMWNMLLGDNAAGKSTLLRCLALGLCYERDASSLMVEVPGDFIRVGAEAATITLTLRGRISGQRASIQTTIHRTASGSEQLRQTTSPKEAFPWKDVFVCAYGTQRTGQAFSSHDSYLVREAVATLFDSQASLMNPEVVFLRQPTEMRYQLEAKLLRMLMLDAPDDEIVTRQDGLAVRGPWGTLPLSVLSDGYRSTSQWILDLIGRALLAERFGEAHEIGGILMIDELEQHLHPRWQRLIVQRLRQQFPHTQIFATTHTPLTASGIADMPSATLFRLDRSETNAVTAARLDRSQFQGLRADQWLASEAFGLVTTRSPGSATDVDEYLDLLRQDPAERDARKFEMLRQRLGKSLSFGETEYEREIEAAVSEVLEKRLQQKPSEPLTEQMKQQLRDLFSPDAEA